MISGILSFLWPTVLNKGNSPPLMLDSVQSLRLASDLNKVILNLYGEFLKEVFLFSCVCFCQFNCPIRSCALGQNFIII